MGASGLRPFEPCCDFKGLMSPHWRKATGCYLRAPCWRLSPRGEVTLYRALMDPASDLGFIQDDYAKLDLKGSVLADGTRLSSDPLGQFLSYEYLDA
jgi:hypothetical protein